MTTSNDDEFGEDSTSRFAEGLPPLVKKDQTQDDSSASTNIAAGQPPLEVQKPVDVETPMTSEEIFSPGKSGD